MPIFCINRDISLVVKRARAFVLCNVFAPHALYSAQRADGVVDITHVSWPHSLIWYVEKARIHAATALAGLHFVPAAPYEQNAASRRHFLTPTFGARAHTRGSCCHSFALRSLRSLFFRRRGHHARALSENKNVTDTFYSAGLGV